MKRILRYSGALTLFATLLLNGGCSDDLLDYRDGEEITITVKPELDGMTYTRHISDGSGIDQLVVAVYEGGSEFSRQTYSMDEARDGLNLRVFKGHQYKVLFWAQDSKSQAFTINNNGTVSVDYSQYLDGGFENMEHLDVFSATGSINTDGKGLSNEVTLTRVMAQVNLGADPDALQPEQGKHRVELEISNLAQTYYPFASASAPQTISDKPLTFTFTDFPEEKLNVDNKYYGYVASCYLLPSANVQITYKLFELEGTEPIFVQKLDPQNLKENVRHNILGDIVKDIQPIDVWDGLSLREPQVVDDKYIIESGANLAWLSANGSKLLPNKTFAVTGAIDMGNKPLSAVTLPVGSTIQGNGRNIINLNLTGGGLFGDAKDLTIKDLNIAISGFTQKATHVGALVNTLTNKGAFDNVKVSGGNISTTNGAAGGIVGYIKDDTDGSGATITFSGCEVSEMSISGDSATGKFVGLLRGYKDVEHLTFSADCQASVTLNSYSSPYREGNEGKWLDPNNYSAYDCWLGNEELYRGNVMFGTMRFIPKWDGTTTVTPLKDGSVNLIYSAFDLAALQGQSSVNMEFKNDVDLGGFRDPANNGTLVTKRNQFIPINSATSVKGNNKTVYNLYIEDEKTPFYGAAFIRLLAGSTVENLTISNAIVLGHPNTDFDDHKAYGGILSGYVTGTNTIKNVHVIGSYVCAVGKLGGFIGTCQGGNTTITNCSVSSCTINNFKVDVKENFSAAGGLVSCDFTQNGEVGGFIGFISSTVTEISNCKVENTEIDCYGEADQTELGLVRVPGRHINRFIGDYRTLTADVKLYLNNCTATGCTVNNESMAYYKSGTKKNEIEIIGSAYYIYAQINVIFKKYEVGSDRKGALYIDGTDRSSALKSVKSTDY